MIYKSIFYILKFDLRLYIVYYIQLMMFEVDQITNCNYIEILVINKKINEHVYNINNKDVDRLLTLFINQNKHLKSFKKHFTKIMKNSLELTFDNNDFSSSLVDLNLINVNKKYDQAFLCNYYNKQPLNAQNFPSTKNIDDIVDIKRVSFKVASNMYLNFDSILTHDEQMYKHVYININVQKNYKPSEINCGINKLLSDLQLVPTY
jgi:hypothetical protein